MRVSSRLSREAPLSALLLAPSLALLCCLTTAAQPATTKPNPAPATTATTTPTASAAWTGRMDAMAVAITDLLPLVMNETQWDEATEGRARADIAALAAVAHDIKQTDTLALPDKDPTVPLLARELSRALSDAQSSRGDKLKSDGHLIAATCIGCHTRARLGSNKPNVSLPSLPANTAAWLRADVALATRRFAEAKQAFHAAAFDENLAAQKPYLWERAVRRGIMLAVRHDADPKEAMALIARITLTPAATEALNKDATAWKSDVAAWQKESPVADAKDPKVTAQQLFARITRLMETADQRARPPSDSGNDILYLRASADLHRLLAYDLDPNMRATALSYLAVAYEALRDVDVWALFILYNEACVEAAPHSLLAAECFERWERGTMTETSGNGGAPLPHELRKRREHLKSLLSTTPHAKQP